MNQLSANTKLKDRTLWFDGDSSYSARNIMQAMTLDATPFTDELNDDIRKYNALVPVEKQIQIKSENRPFSFEWSIPDEYKNLNIVDYVIDKLHIEFAYDKFPESELADRMNRVSRELALYKKHGVFAVLQVLIFVINTLDKHGVVWGVGRGSSVSSYVLYLIGVHDVDSVKYELSITDFLH